jgi:hypothetical protein
MMGRIKLQARVIEAVTVAKVVAVRRLAAQALAATPKRGRKDQQRSR